MNLRVWGIAAVWMLTLSETAHAALVAPSSVTFRHGLKMAPHSRAIIETVAQAMALDPGIRLVKIEGFTASPGGDAHNLKLSERRAERVREVLIELGADPQRLLAKGYGETRPLVDEVTKADRQINNRVEFVVVSAASVAK